MKLFRPLLLALLALSAAAAGAESQTRALRPDTTNVVRRRAARPAELAQKIDAAVARHLARPLPGVSVSILRGDQLIHAKGFGFTDVAAAMPVTTSSIFQAGSVTKQFTAAAIMRLQEEGKLSVEDEVSKWIPELPTRGNTIRIRHLLNHTSGLPEYTRYLTDPYRPLPLAAMINLIKDKPFTFPTGEGWAYGNSGFYLLGTVVERASGQRYETFVRERLALPQGLVSTGICGSAPTLVPPAGYLELNAKGRYERVDPIEPSNAGAAGSLCSTPSDLVRWSKALASGRVVTRTSYEAMTSHTRYGPGGLAGYGYGLAVGSNPRGAVVEHGGSVLGFETYLGHYPAHDLTIAVMVNVTIVPGEGVASAIGNEVANLVLGR